MSSKLDKIIGYYEKERVTLTALIDECIDEMDYKLAHVHAKGLRILNQRLRILYSFKDQFYDDKERSNRMIVMLEERMSSEDSKDLRDYYAELIGEERRKLAQWSAPAKPAAHHRSKSALREAFDKLLSRQIESFVLVLEAWEEPQALRCTIKLVRKTVSITLPQIRQHIANSLLSKSQVRYLKRLGFRFYDNKNLLILFLPCFTPEQVKGVQLILAQVMFEGLYPKQFKSSSIRYFER